MRKKLLAILLAALAMFIWGFLFWAADVGSPRDHMTRTQETVIVTALKLSGIEAGVYTLRDPTLTSPEQYNAEAKKGPVATLAVEPAGYDPADMTALAYGYLHYVVLALLLSLILGRARGNSINVIDTTVYSATIGLTVAVATRLSDVVWLHTPLRAMISESLYIVVAFALAGLVLSLVDRTDPMKQI